MDSGAKTTNTAPTGDSQTLLQRLGKVTTALQRVFFFNLLVSLVIIYLVGDASGLWMRSGLYQSRIRGTMTEALEDVTRAVAFSEALQNDYHVVAQYEDLIDCFMTIENAALNAYLATGDSDPRRAVLNLEDVRRVKSESSTLASLEMFDLPHDERLRSLDLDNISGFLSKYVFPEQLVDTRDAVKVIESSLRILSALGKSVPDSPPIPASFYFVDFVRGLGSADGIVQQIDSLRDIGYFRYLESRSVLKNLCAANALKYCSLAEIEGAINKQDFVLPEPGTKDIQVSFFPTGVKRSVLIAVAPVILFLSFGIYLCYNALKWTLSAELSRLGYQGLALNDRLWLSPSGHPGSPDADDWFKIPLRVIGQIAFLVIQSLPIVAQAATTVFLVGSMDGSVPSFIWKVLVGLCLLWSAVALAYVTIGQWRRGEIGLSE